MTMSPARLRLYWETVRHLRPAQLYGRVWCRAARPRPDLRTAPGLRAKARGWVSPARRRQSQFGADEFRFLNETRTLARHGWDDALFPKLWRYNLHYFDDLNAEGAAERVGWHGALIERWIAENPPGKGTGWEPYPTSLRIVNWVKWALAGNDLPREAVRSLAVQARWLTRRLEVHLLGNHLFANAKALVFAGCFFDGPEAEAWLDLGLRILGREIPEQILADGGHFELSTMYHALALEDMLDLVNVMRSAGLAVPASWSGKVDAMREWLAGLCHPDGEIAFFNDAAIGIAPSPSELEGYAVRLGCSRLSPMPPGCRHFAESGYVRLQNERTVVLIDVARVGPDYLPGHAHADTLSFELSVDGRRVLVNSGTSVYGTGEERLRQRGTAAHNTVLVAGENSSEVWSGFRVARRARPFDLKVEGDTVSCSHDGYKRLKGRPVHRRTWRLDTDGLTVEDSVSGPHGSEARFHFHPRVGVGISGEAGAGSTALHGGGAVRWQAVSGSARLEPASFHPEFGISQPTSCLAVALAGGQCTIRLSWI
ncbi:MAG: alginate lyase family protein [Rhizobiaceae bacterium]